MSKITQEQKLAGWETFSGEKMSTKTDPATKETPSLIESLSRISIKEEATSYCEGSRIIDEIRRNFGGKLHQGDDGLDSGSMVFVEESSRIQNAGPKPAPKPQTPIQATGKFTWPLFGSAEDNKHNLQAVFDDLAKRQARIAFQTTDRRIEIRELEDSVMALKLRLKEDEKQRTELARPMHELGDRFKIML